VSQTSAVKKTAPARNENARNHRRPGIHACSPGNARSFGLAAKKGRIIPERAGDGANTRPEGAVWRVQL